MLRPAQTVFWLGFNIQHFLPPPLIQQAKAFFWLFQAGSKCKGMWPLPFRIKLAHSLSPLPLCLSRPPHPLPTAHASCHASLPSLPLHSPPHPALVTAWAASPCTLPPHMPPQHNHYDHHQAMRPPATAMPCSHHDTTRLPLPPTATATIKPCDCDHHATSHSHRNTT
jgi:hypothetical protein